MTEPTIYRKRPMQIEAMGPLTPANYEEITRWCGGQAQARAKLHSNGLDRWIDLTTTESKRIQAFMGWYVMRASDGEYRPIPRLRFEALYEPVKEAPEAKPWLCASYDECACGHERDEHDDGENCWNDFCMCTQFYCSVCGPDAVPGEANHD